MGEIDEEELDGIDTSLIIRGGRGGRSTRTRKPVNYRVDVSGSDEEY